jgi:hypothetical protein
MVKLIDSMARRGAIEGVELYDVGLLRNRLTFQITSMSDPSRHNLINENIEVNDE